MSSISNTFRSIIWFGMCMAMIAGVVLFAVIIAIFSVFSKAFSWKGITFPAIKLAK